VGRKRLLVLLLFTLLSAGKLAISQQALFPVENEVPVNQPANQCSGCDYLPVLSAPGASADFNHDGKMDFAYVEAPSTGTSDQFLVVVLGRQGGQPTQVATDLQTCTATSFTVGNVNGDSYPDVVVLCSQGYAATFLGNGDGSFQAPVHAAVPSGVQAVALTDVNGDGLADAAYTFSVTNGSTGYAISLNQGAGKFASPINYPLTLGQASGLAAGDFNGDGKQDLAFGTGFVLGNGDGTFGPEQALPAGIGKFVVGDFNHDGLADLAYSISAENPGSTGPSSGLYLILGSSTGLTAAPATIAASGFSGAGLTALIFSGSGALDLIAYQSFATSIFPGQGNGSFAPPRSYAQSIFAVGDANADGVPDLIGTDVNADSPVLTVAYGNSDGTVQALPLTLGGNLTSLADMNGDGLPDAISKTGTTPPQVWLSTGDGRFIPAPSLSSATDYGSFTVTADFTGDGLPDVVSISTRYDTYHGQTEPPLAQQQVYRGNGDGTLTYLNQSSLGVETVIGAVAGDFNQDAKQDVVLAYNDLAAQAGGAIFVAGNGDGTFAAPKRIALLGHAPRVIATADLNGDGKMDLVVSDQSGTVVAYLGNGDGTFSATAQILAIQALSLALGDVTGDKIPDLICSNGKDIEVYPGNGDGTFATTPVFSANLSNAFLNTLVQIGDVNGDGMLDIAAAYTDTSNTGRLAVFLNQGSGNFVQDKNAYFTGTGGASQFALTQLNRVPAGASKQSLNVLVSGSAGLVYLLNQLNSARKPAPAVTLTTANNQTAVTAGQTVTVTASLFTTGPTAATGTITFFVNQQQAGVSTVMQGQASLPISIMGAGLITIRAVYSGDPNYPGSMAFLQLTSTAVATTTTLASSASSAAQGVNVTFSATVAPATATGTVTFLDGSTTLGTAALASGVATYSTAALAVGSHSITAMYGGDPDDAASASSAVTVAITAATIQLSATPPTLTITAGSTGSTTIAVTPMGAYAGTVTLSCANLPANSTCTFAPASLAFTAASQAAQSTQLTIATNVAAQARLDVPNIRPGGGYTKLLAGVWLFVMPGATLMVLRCRKDWLRRGVLLVLLTAVLATVSACGSSGSSTPPGPKTPPGTSTVTVSATGSSSTLSLTVTIAQ
jgi:hypothetical protein